MKDFKIENYMRRNVKMVIKNIPFHHVLEISHTAYENGLNSNNNVNNIMYKL